MAEIVYSLCALTSTLCAVMLFRGFFASRTRLLLWSSLCFVGLAANNGLLLLDKIVLPENDLSIARGITGLLALLLLVFGLIWDSD